ncbi:hypothetical protein F4803DRAFT_346723 [Xylaria telfairii]|nr:hypothetical protein F4803DRAFT_346723 [Xylaria telfairii]
MGFVGFMGFGFWVEPSNPRWIDPFFTKCVLTQYTTPYPTFSPGVCPAHMGIVDIEAENKNGATIYTATCCQSGFSPISIDSGYLCTSSITSPMAFLLDPNISTDDIYTTLPPELWIEHDQITVQWEPTDLELFPVVVASQYAHMMNMMGITPLPSTDNVASKTTNVLTPSANIPKVPGTSAVWPGSTTLTTPATSTSEPTSESHSQSSPTNNTAWRDVIGSAFLLFFLIGIGMVLLG